MFKSLLVLCCIISPYMLAMEKNKQIVHVHTSNDDLDISIMPGQTIAYIKEIITRREGIIPEQQVIIPVWLKWLIFKENGPIADDDTPIQTIINAYNTHDLEVVFIPLPENTNNRK